jgi:hydroxypyruvate isomerase
MPKFAANLSMMYPELPFLERFEAAAKDGFKAVEFLFPYAFSPQEIAARLHGNGLTQVLFNAPPGGTDAVSIAHGWDKAGDRGTAAVPGREAEFRTGVQLALDYADVLDCPRIHVMAGLLPQGVSREALQPLYVANLQWAAEQAAARGRDIMIEPINTRDIPRFFLNRQDHAHEVLAAVGASNVKVQMDRQYLPTGAVGHFQIAGVPERQEPDIGELNYSYLFKVIDEVSAACGWDGWIGCEYRPLKGGQPGGTRAGLGWMRR